MNYPLVIEESAKWKVKVKGSKIFISGDEFGKNQPLGKLREKAKSYLKSLFSRNAKFRNQDKEITIWLSNRGIKKTFSLSGKKEKLQSMCALPEILKHSKHVGEAPPKNSSQTEIKRYHYFKAEIDISGKIFKVKMTVSEHGDKKHRYYFHRLDKMTSAEFEAGSTSREETLPASTPAIEESIPEKGSKVNEETTIQEDVNLLDPIIRIDNAVTKDELINAVSAVVISNNLILKGNKTIIETARGMEVEVQYLVIPQALMVASHSARGQRNPEFPDNFQNTSRDRMKAKLQNRDRSSHVSRYQADQMAKNLRPRLLGANPFASDGAPVTNSKLKPGKYVVLSGNGRTISLGLACALKNDSNDKYFDWLSKEARNFGIKPAEISKIRCPRLIRNVKREMATDELTKFVKQSNKPSIQAPSAQEVAVEDASDISTDMLKLISPTKDGRIEGNVNIGFINMFFQNVLENDPAEIGRMQTKDGKLTDEGVDRITRAVFMRAYGDPTLIDKMVRRGDDESKKLTKGLLMAAPEMAKLGDDLADVNRLDLDISSDVVKAVLELETIRSEKGRTVEDVLAYVTFGDDDIRNDPAIVELLKGLEKTGIGHRGKSDNVKEFILEYIKQANAAVQESTMASSFASVFGEAEYEKDKMLEAARKAVVQESIEGVETEDIAALMRIISGNKDARKILSRLLEPEKNIQEGIDDAMGKSIEIANIEDHFIDQILGGAIELTIEEKQITFPKKYGQIVFLAGGGGSGKGFVISKFMNSSNFKTIDVDYWKGQFLKLAKETDKYPELKGMDLRNPKHVFALHQFVKKKKIKAKKIKGLFDGVKIDRLPNVIFDVTMNDEDSMREVIPMALKLGYDPKDIHLVWVLTNFHTAMANNKTRDRIVPDDIMLEAHEGVALVMNEVLKGRGFIKSRKKLDGTISVVLNNREETKFYPDGKTIKGFTYLTAKKRGKRIGLRPEDEKKLALWIRSNIPRTKKTKELWNDGKAKTIEESVSKDELASFVDAVETIHDILGVAKVWHSMLRKEEKTEEKPELPKNELVKVSSDPISSGDSNAVEKLTKKLIALDHNQKLMKKVNAAYRKFKKNPDSLDKADLSEGLKKVIRIYEPEYSWDKGPFADYRLKNNNATIRQVRKRIEELEKHADDETTTIYDKNGIKIVDNVEENRLQIFFPEKPNAEVRKALKSRGFKFSYTFEAWQRFRSSDANYYAKELVKEFYEKGKIEEQVSANDPIVVDVISDIDGATQVSDFVAALKKWSNVREKVVVSDVKEAVAEIVENKANLGKLPIDLAKPIAETEFRPFGSWKGEAVKGNRNKISPKERLQINTEVEDILKKARQDMSEADLKKLQQYSGFGGTKAEDEKGEVETGVLYDFYTSPPVALATYKIIDKMFKIEPGMKALEPSCGNGVFMEVAPSGLNLSGVEYDARSSACADALHDNAKVHNASFEEFNLHSNEEFDLIIGNAPFGDRSANTIWMDEPDEKNMDRYFLKKSLKKLKPGGMMGLIVHSGVFENPGNSDWRKELLKYGKFEGAIRLPSESFQHTDTQVSPDMIFFKRHDASLQSYIDRAEDHMLISAGIYDATEWVEGSRAYYREYPKHKLGEDAKGNFDRIYTKGKMSADRLDSAIASFQKYQYAFDVTSLREATENLPFPKKDRTEKLTEAEAKAVANKDLRKGKIKVTDNAVYMLNDKYEWEYLIDAAGELGEKIGRVLHLSQLIRQIRYGMQNGEPVDALQKEARGIIQEYNKTYSNWHHDDKVIKRFFKQHSKIAGFEGVDIDIDHEILTNQNIYQKEIKYVDGHNIAIKALESYQDKNVLEVTTDQLNDYAPAFGDTIIEECYKHNDIFLDEDLKWQLRENFIQGNAWEKISRLNDTQDKKSIAGKDKEKLEYSINELKEKAGWVSLEDIQPRPYDKWLPKEVVHDWLSSIGVKKIFHNGQEWEAERDSNNKLYPESAKVMRFLNRQNQRGDTDTKHYNEKHMDSFERFISTEQGIREQIEEIYNMLYGGEIKGPNKTYSIDIDGWQDNGKSIRPNQWQAIHHLLRLGCGTNGGFVGSGKTMAQVALFGILRQEGKVKRGYGQVPNNKVRDWVRNFNKFLPSLKIGYIDQKGEDLEEAERNRRLQQLANGSYDVVILPESIATKVGLSPSSDDAINLKMVGIKTKDEKDGEGKSARAKAKDKESAIRKVQVADGKSNQTVTFDDFNFDFMFIDESHNGKAIFKSKKSRGLGFKGGRESDRAMAMYKKMEAVRMKTGGKYTFGNTATPISNSPIEMFNQLHLMGGGDELQKRGISTIDDFIDEFCEVEEIIAVDWATSEPKQKKKLVGFHRVGKLQELFKKYVDYQYDPNAVDINKPTATNIANEIPADEQQKTTVLGIRDQLQEWKKDKDLLEESKFKAKWGSANYLTFFSKLRTASLDLELHDPDANPGWKNPKLGKLVEKAWENFTRTGGGQVVFCDRVLSSNGKLSMHNKIRDALIKVGFKENEIVIVNGQVKGGLGKGKLSESKMESVVTRAIDGFNAGKYRVIIGTTNTLGEGVNLQKNSGALHHFDIPYRPSDFIQRNGRIDRQGNAQKNVELNTYLSKGSIDTYSKAIVSDKENWINQLLNTKSNVFANPDEGFDESSLEIALAEEFDTPENVQRLKQEMEEKQKKAELEYNKNQVENIFPKYELICGAIWEFKGDKASQVYQNMLRKRDEYRNTLEKNPEFKHPDLLKEEGPFFFEKDTGAVYRPGDYFLSEKGIHELIKINPKKANMVLEPVDETWRKTQRDNEYVSRRGYVEYPDHKGYTISEKLPSHIKHMPELKTPERLAQIQTVFGDDDVGFYEQPLDFQIKNYKEFFQNRKKEEVPFYFVEGSKLRLNAFSSFGDEPKKVKGAVHPDKAIKSFKERLLDGTASIDINHSDDAKAAVIAKVGQSTWNEWKKAEQQGEHPWLPEAYKYLDSWITKEELEKKLEKNKDFQNDISTHKISNTFYALPDIKSRSFNDETYYIKISALKDEGRADNSKISEIARKYSQLNERDLSVADERLKDEIDSLLDTWELDSSFFKDGVRSRILKTHAIMSQENLNKAVDELMPAIREYVKEKKAIQADEEKDLVNRSGISTNQLLTQKAKTIGTMQPYNKAVSGDIPKGYLIFAGENDFSGEHAWTGSSTGAGNNWVAVDPEKPADVQQAISEGGRYVIFFTKGDAKRDLVAKHNNATDSQSTMTAERLAKKDEQEAINDFIDNLKNKKYMDMELAFPKLIPQKDRGEDNADEIDLPLIKPAPAPLTTSELDEERSISGIMEVRNVKLPDPTEEPAIPKPVENETVSTSDTDLKIDTFTHTKTGAIMGRVKMADRVDRSRYGELKVQAKRFGGFWSKFAKGFLFKEPEKAKEFANSLMV
jgi:hypothetical protein